MTLRADMTTEEFWKEWGRTSPPNIRERDAIQQIEAPVAKKGGSKKGKNYNKKKLSEYKTWVLS